MYANLFCMPFFSFLKLFKIYKEYEFLDQFPVKLLSDSLVPRGSQQEVLAVDQEPINETNQSLLERHVDRLIKSSDGGISGERILKLRTRVSKLIVISSFKNKDELM